MRPRETDQTNGFVRSSPTIRPLTTMFHLDPEGPIAPLTLPVRASAISPISPLYYRDSLVVCADHHITLEFSAIFP